MGQSSNVAIVALEVERVVLSNGIRVLLAPNDGIPAFCLMATVDAGSRYEVDDNAGIASFAGLLLDQGAGHRTADELASDIEDVGGRMTTFGGYAHSGVRIVALSEHLPLAVELAADCLRRPHFPEERVSLHRERRIAQLESRAEQPRVRASELFDELIYAGHPAHRPIAGYISTVGELSREAVVEHHRVFYDPAATTVTLAGRFDPAMALSTISASFEDWSANPEHRLPAVPEVAIQQEPAARSLTVDKSQAHVYMGHLGVRRSDPDYYALLLLDTILGSSPGFTSRIPRLLRDQLGLAYTTFANVAASAGVDPGRFVAYIATAPSNVDRAVDALRGEIERIVSEPVDEAELATARSYLTGSCVFRFQTNAQVAAFLLEAEVHGLGFDFVKRFPGLIENVTVEDVLGAARRHIHPAAMTTVVVGPDVRQER